MSFFVSRIRPPPCSTLFPYTTLFRSVGARVALRRNGQVETADGWAGSVSAGVVRPESELRFRPDDTGAHTPRPSVRSLDLPVAAQRDARPHRSEERRVGKECRARRRPDA